jgi:large subunit ribosomal protein L13
MGKHRPEYTPHVLSGDHVIITNAEKIVLTGKKFDQKTLSRYSGYPGGQRVESYRTVIEKNPERLVRQAVVRMLPSGRLGREMESRLKIYVGEDHPHTSQNPEVVETSTS